MYAILGCAPMELPLYWGIYLSFPINVDIITYRYLIYCFINYNFLEHPYGIRVLSYIVTYLFIFLPFYLFLLSYTSFILQPRSESYAWQWGGEVIVLVVILIQEIHLLHAEEWQTLWEETDKIGYTS